MQSTNQPTNPQLASALAEAVRRACLQAALAGYEDAASNGLCPAGAWEAAVSAIHTLQLEPIVQAVLDDQNSNR